MELVNEQSQHVGMISPIGNVGKTFPTFVTSVVSFSSGLSCGVQADDKTSFEREKAAFEAILPRLRKYQGHFVAIHNGQDVDFDMSRNLLLGGVFKVSDFPAPALGQVGALGRNMYTNPGYADTDLSLMRNFKLPFFTAEGLNMQFRAEAINAFNRVNLAGIQGDMNNVNFGKVTAITGTPRRFLFGLRLSF